MDLLARALDAADAPGLLADPRIATPSAALVLAWSLAAAVAAHAVATRWRALGIVALAFTLATLLMRSPRIERDLDARVSVLDVGQGQAVLVEIARPGMQPWRALVDAGGWPGSRFDVGERLIAPALWDRGICRLDALVLTHADFDHRGGAPSVIRLLRPARLILAPVETRARAALAPAIAAAESVGASVELAATGSVLGPDGELARLRALWPPRDPAARRGLSSNDAGLVLLLESAGGRGMALLPAAPSPVESY